MLGVGIESVKPVCLFDKTPYAANDVDPGCILVSPFSASCSSRKGERPNKMLPVTTWLPIIDYLKTLGRPLYVLGSSTDRPIPEFNLPDRSFLLGTHSLLQIARIMRDRAVVIVTVDNGMSHLAASQVLPTFLFCPACLPISWIFPRGNPHCIPLQLDPASCDSVQVLEGVQATIPSLLSIQERGRG
jgi:ADP-heptose:LPS heptosyltransferase